MIRLPGVGALVLDAMTTGRWSEARAIARERPYLESGIMLEPAPARDWELLVLVFEEYLDSVDKKEHEARCNVCDDVVGLHSARDFDGDTISVLDWHGGGFACTGSQTMDYGEVRTWSRVPIAHALESRMWPYRATGVGLEDLTRDSVITSFANLEDPVDPAEFPWEHNRRARLVVEHAGTPRSFQVFGAKGKKLFYGVIGKQRLCQVGEAVDLSVGARSVYG